jgi:Na+/proline symporter
MSSMLFSYVDWIVFIATLAVSVGVGVYYALQARYSTKPMTTDDYLMGGRRLPLVGVTLSLLVGAHVTHEMHK